MKSCVRECFVKRLMLHYNKFFNIEWIALVDSNELFHTCGSILIKVSFCLQGRLETKSVHSLLMIFQCL